MIEVAPGLLLDTHAAVWLADGSLNKKTVQVLERAEIAGGNCISPVNAWEIGLLARSSERRPTAPQFLPGPREWFADLTARFRLVTVPLTAEMAIAASLLPGTLHKDPADRLLIATARELGLAILTADRAILDYARQGHVRAVAC